MQRDQQTVPLRKHIHEWSGIAVRPTQVMHYPLPAVEKNLRIQDFHRQAELAHESAAFFEEFLAAPAHPFRKLQIPLRGQTQNLSDELIREQTAMFSARGP